MFLIGITLIVIGWGTRHWVERRKFYRRTGVGTEQFPSYTRMLVTRFIEGIVALIGGIASLGGILIIGYHALVYFNVL